VAKSRQLRLPKFQEIEIVKKISKFPQPHEDAESQIKLYEIFHRPFDLHFRGILYRWLASIKSKQKLKLREVLNATQYKVFNLYFYPQKPKDRWLNQEDVLSKVQLRSKKRLRQTLISALIRIWKNIK
jgi:hypothetical protein